MALRELLAPVRRQRARRVVFDVREPRPGADQGRAAAVIGDGDPGAVGGRAEADIGAESHLLRGYRSRGHAAPSQHRRLRLSGLQAAPEEVREPPEHAGAHGPTPRLRAVTHGEVGDDRRAKVDSEAGVGPLFEPRGYRYQQQPDAEDLGQRELHAEVVGEAEVGECRRYLRQAQLGVSREAYLQAEEPGDDKIGDGLGFGGGLGADEGRLLQGRLTGMLPRVEMTVLHRRSNWTTLGHPQMDTGRSFISGRLRGGNFLDAPFEQGFLRVRRRGRKGALRVLECAVAISAPPVKLSESRIPQVITRSQLGASIASSAASPASGPFRSASAIARFKTLSGDGAMRSSTS